jgi:MarR family transcriptional regulator, multiple antibiotic resistance protein MarR
MKNLSLLDGHLEDNIGFLLGHSNRIKDRLLDRHLQDAGITGTQAKVLFHIYIFKHSRQCDIGKKLNVDGSAVTRLLDRMEKRGLSRVLNPNMIAVKYKLSLPKKD